jgi:hypothetical protein
MRRSFVAAALFCSGCFLMSNAYTTREQVLVAAREYNDGVRWGKFEQAANRVPKDQRKKFFEKHRGLEEELEFADYELTAVDVDKSDKKHVKVTAQVDYTWSLKREGLVQKTSTKQHWEEQNSEWVLVREERFKGAPLTLFEEPTATQ